MVPLPFRMLYAFFHREGMRKGEAKALGWPEIDLKRGLVSLDENKTDRPRSWVLDSGVLRALAAWHEDLGKPTTGRVFDAIPAAAWEKLAPIYRGHCEAVGVDRARLFQKKEKAAPACPRHACVLRHGRDVRGQGRAMDHRSHGPHLAGDGPCRRASRSAEF